MIFYIGNNGGVAERPNAPVLKTGPPPPDFMIITEAWRAAKNFFIKNLTLIYNVI